MYFRDFLHFNVDSNNLFKVFHDDEELPLFLSSLKYNKYTNEIITFGVSSITVSDLFFVKKWNSAQTFLPIYGP